MTQSTQMINQPQLDEYTKCIQECGSLPLSLANLCASYLFSNITIPLDLKQAENLPTLHFTAEDLTRLLNGSYGLVCLKGQKECDQVCSHGVKDEMTALNLNILKKPEVYDLTNNPYNFLGFAEQAQKYGPKYALNGFETAVNYYLNNKIKSAIAALIIDASGMRASMTDALQRRARYFIPVETGLPRFETRQDADFFYTIKSISDWDRTLDGKPLPNFLKVVETIRLFFVRYDSQAKMNILQTKALPHDEALGYYQDAAPAENINPTCELVAEQSQDNIPVFKMQDGDKWLKILTDQCRTSMLLTLHDDTTEFFMRDWVEDTQQQKARDEFIQKYIAPLKNKPRDTQEAALSLPSSS